jgi:hypothetical protein
MLVNISLLNCRCRLRNCAVPICAVLHYASLARRVTRTRCLEESALQSDFRLLENLHMLNLRALVARYAEDC